jgi:hypothetical protein
MTTPRFTVFDGGGIHNANLTRTTERLRKQGSWKRQRVAVIIPAADKIQTKVAMSWWNMAFPPNNGVVKILAEGMEVGAAYSAAIENILDHPDIGKWEYILTVEHDNTPPPDGAIKLIERMEEHPEFSCIGGLYFTKGEGGCAQIWGDPNDPIQNFRPQPPDPSGGLVECCGTGMGFNLWKMEMFRDQRLRRPWFKTLNGKDGQGVGTQDLYFWTDARKYGYRCAVDCSVKVGHVDEAGFVW